MSPNKAINAASFREWFNKSLDEEARTQIRRHGANLYLFEDYGGEAILYDRFMEEIWGIALDGESSLASALGDGDLGCVPWLRSAMVLKATDKLAAERYGGPAASAGSGVAAPLR